MALGAWIVVRFRVKAGAGHPIAEEPSVGDPGAGIRVLLTDSEPVPLEQEAQPVRGAPPRLPRNAPGDTSLPQKLEAIDWFQFERVIARAYEKLGYSVERRGGAHADDGIDLVIHRNGESVGVQCKHWKAWRVNPKTVREMLGAITAAKLRSGTILCWRGFTREGQAKAAEYGITLVDAPGILQMLESVDARFDPEMQALLDDRRKYCPKCEAEMVLRTPSKGPSAGEPFWGCSRYPRCTYTFEVAGSLR